MSAPLYSRFKRKIDRELRAYKRTLIPNAIRSFKRSDTRIYSISRRASFEAGAWSISHPKELLQFIEEIEFPTQRVWVECDWVEVLAGATGGAYTEDMTWGNSDGRPIRMGFLFEKEPGSDQIVFFIFNLYEGGSVRLQPLTFLITKKDRDFTWEPNTVEEIKKRMGVDLESAPLGLNYFTNYKENPRLINKLKKKLDMGILFPSERESAKKTRLERFKSAEMLAEIMRETHGTPRLALGALAVCFSAKAMKYEPIGKDVPIEPVEIVSHEGVHEINLYVRDRPRGKSPVRHGLLRQAQKKKALHTVGGHWAYRQRKDGSDPTRCELGRHDFEDVENTHSQVCLKCGQKRWWREAHERGDEQYGVVPQKTFNVRVGG